MERMKTEPRDPCKVKLWNPPMEDTELLDPFGEKQAWSRLCDGERQARGACGLREAVRRAWHGGSHQRRAADAVQGPTMEWPVFPFVGGMPVSAAAE